MMIFRRVKVDMVKRGDRVSKEVKKSLIERKRAKRIKNIEITKRIISIIIMKQNNKKIRIPNKQS